MAHRSMARLRLVAILAVIAAFAIVPGPSQAGVITFHATPAAFASAASNFTLVTEDFEDANVGDFGVAGCPGTANSTTNNACFNTGDINAGIEVAAAQNAQSPFGLAIAGQGFAGAPNRVVVSNFFVDNTNLNLAGYRGVALSLVGYFGGGPCTVTVTLSDSTVGSTGANCTAGGDFLGVTATHKITKINITGSAGPFFCCAEGVAAITYGNPSCDGSVISGATGADVNEDGPVSGTVHGAEGGLGPAGPVAHEASCVAAFAGA